MPLLDHFRPPLSLERPWEGSHDGVREYIAWRVFDRAIDWFVLRGGQFEPLPTAADRIARSETLPGLWLDPQALVNGDLLQVAQIAQQGTSSPEHAAFAARLRQP